MRNKLLITTALVAVSFTASAMADSEITLTAKTSYGAAAVWTGLDGQELVGLEKTDDIQYNLNSDKSVTAKINNKETVFGAFSNYFGRNNRADGDGDHVALSGLTLKDSAFNGNSGTVGGAMSLWTDGREVGTSVIDTLYPNDKVPEPVKNYVKDTKFINNTAQKGGAVATLSAMALDTPAINEFSNVTFSGNTATGTKKDKHNGAGALYIENSTTYIKDSTFNGNTAKTNGGAIFNAGTLTIDGASFDGNSANQGGAILTRSLDKDKGLAKTVIKSSMFTNNSASSIGGAVYGYFNSDTDISNSIFEGNTAKWGGALWGDQYMKNLTVSDTTFLNNSALGAGAVGIFNEATLQNVVFSNNHATDAEDDGAGALFLGAISKTVINTADFSENTSAVDGGAIAMRNASQANNSAAKLDIFNASFEKNSAVNNGGAIYSTFLDSKTTESAVHIENSKFASNEAKNGGAIYVTGDKDRVGNNAAMQIKDLTFTDNNATTDGGAIYNGSKLSMSGTNVFSGNKANGKLNDIHNLGHITVSGDLELDGGISGNGTTTFEKGSNLTVNTGTTTISNNIFNQGATLNLKFDTGYIGLYQLVTDTGSLDKEFDIAENNVYDVVSLKNGTYDISMKSVDAIAEAVGADANQASVIETVISSDTNNSTLNEIAENINSMLQSSDELEVQAALDAATALAPDVAPMVQQTQADISNQVFGAVGTRLTGGPVASTTQGISSGDNPFERVVAWVQGLFNKSELDDSKDAKGFDAKTYGTAFGFEKYLDNSVKVGFGYAYSKTDIDGFLRDTDVKTHTAILYGEYKPSSWYVNGIATYGWSDYVENKDVTGIGVKADYDVETFGLQAMTGYELDVSGFTLTPEVGLRYVFVSQKGYKNSLGSHISGDDSDILTGIVGAKVSKTYELSNGANIIPEARVAVTYDMSHDKVGSIVTLADGSSYAVQGKAYDRSALELGFGVTADVTDQIDLSVGYELKLRDDYQDNTWLINAKYNF